MNRFHSTMFFSIVVGLITFVPFNSLTAQEQAEPQLYKSKNFQVVTDLSKEESEELLIRLETMLKNVSAYWGRRNRKPIRMYVIDDFEKWPDDQLAKMAPEGVTSVRQGGGLTISRVRGIVGGPKLDAAAIVYATSEHQTPQHEAIHAYCSINFGSTGPVWYSEGMAEVGKYWQNDEKGVNAGPYVIKYLQSQDPKPLNDIVNNPLERTGDSWQNYAWRWALCHLLGFNENYTKRFKPLGLALLADRDVSFARVYGAQAREIEFEYHLFLADMEPGYRCDLCSWDWRTDFSKVTSRRKYSSKIDADHGWQATRATLEEGNTYSIEVEGDWELNTEDRPVSVAGNPEGDGQLLGIMFNDYELSEPFVIGDATEFVAPTDGDLFLRCQEDWGKIADNSGTVNVRIGLKEDVSE